MCGIYEGRRRGRQGGAGEAVVEWAGVGGREDEGGGVGARGGGMGAWRGKSVWGGREA